MTSTSTPARKLTAGPTETRQAEEALASLRAAPPQHWVADNLETPLTLGPELSQILTKVVEVLASGGTVTIGSMPEVLTTTAAADILGISRTALMRHVESGALPAHKVGSHTRIRRDDVMAFRKARLERQRAAFARLLELEDTLEDGASG